LSKREIGGLKGEISVLKERLEAQTSVTEQRVKLATEALSASSGAKDETKEDFQSLKTALAAKADDTLVAALASKLDTAIGKWETANGAVFIAVSPGSATMGLEGARSGFGIGEFPSRYGVGPTGFPLGPPSRREEF
jgi:hypothetical protein